MIRGVRSNSNEGCSLNGALPWRGKAAITVASAHLIRRVVARSASGGHEVDNLFAGRRFVPQPEIPLKEST